MRRMILAAGMLGGLIGLWIFVADSLSFLSNDTARLAAQIGTVRGDLWARVALAEQRRELSDPQIGAGSSLAEDSRKAVALSPWRADAWLLLAAASKSDPEASQRALSMSYMTGLGQDLVDPGSVVPCNLNGGNQRPQYPGFGAAGRVSPVTKVPAGPDCPCRNLSSRGPGESGGHRRPDPRCGSQVYLSDRAPGEVKCTCSDPGNLLLS